PQKRGISKEEAQVRAAIQEAAKAYELPPIFLDEPDDMDMAGSFSKLCQDAAAAKEPVPDICNQLRTLLTVSVASGYMWGAQDVAAIKAVLGYGSQEIPGKCQLRLEPMGLDIGGSVFAGQRRDFRSSHDVKSLSFRAKAVCNPPSGALPKSGGVITRLRGKYAVALPRDVTCAVQRGTLEVQYGGDGAAKCN
ncbi:MAG: hypothetical protein HGA90_03480, partial [Alphaproteobacteria bacterium]|nr:hypothetical protein [Alphaproteobacteria bacterium]